METETKKKQSVLPVIIAASAMVLLVSIVAVVLLFSGDKRKLQKQLDEGRRYLSELDYEKATVAFRDAVRIDPDNEEVLDLFHDSYLRWMESDPERAEEIRGKEFHTLYALLAEGPSEPVERLWRELADNLEQ